MPLVTQSSITGQGASRLRLEKLWINIAEMIIMCIVKCVEKCSDVACVIKVSYFETLQFIILVYY